MTPALRAALGGALALAAGAGIAALSQLPYAPPAAEEAVLRLSWRAVGERVEECRRLSEEERAALPVHMRREEVCEGRLLPSHLWVEVGGRVVVDDTVRPAGARGDRPIFVFREVRLPPGEHAVRVRFSREDRGGDAPTPPLLELADTFALGAAEVALVTFDADRRVLVARTPARAAPLHTRR
jgi:hypothetical protein